MPVWLAAFPVPHAFSPLVLKFAEPVRSTQGPENLHARNFLPAYLRAISDYNRDAGDRT